MSWTSAPRLVKPQAMWSLWPTMMKGVPGRAAPRKGVAAGVGGAGEVSYQMPGTPWERCMSLERRGLPEAVWEPETTQLLEPAMQVSQPGWGARVCCRARRAGMSVGGCRLLL